MAQAASNHPGEPTIVIDLAETMKMPEPIIDPTTIIVASIRPRPRTKRVASVGACPAGESIRVFPQAEVVEELQFVARTRGRYANYGERSNVSETKVSRGRVGNCETCGVI